MLRFKGPYLIHAIDEKHSTVTLEIPHWGHPRGTETFHTSLIHPCVKDKANWFEKPVRPTLNKKGEAVIECILHRKKRGKGYSYLIKWEGFPEEENEWLPGRLLQDCEALDQFYKEHGLDKNGNKKADNSA